MQHYILFLPIWVLSASLTGMDAGSKPQDKKKRDSRGSTLSLRCEDETLSASDTETISDSEKKRVRQSKEVTFGSVTTHTFKKDPDERKIDELLWLKRQAAFAAYKKASKLVNKEERAQAIKEAQAKMEAVDDDIKSLDNRGVIALLEKLGKEEQAQQ